MRSTPAFETVGPEILQEYLDTASDFAFELRTKRALAEAKVEHEHGGSYVDSTTGKVRQFDLRAWVSSRTSLNCAIELNLAVECKNIRDFNPLLVHCVPREEHECFHEISFNTGSEAGDLRCTGRDSRYKLGELTGKSWAQVNKPAKKDARVTGGDSEIYDKWAQALASANDLLRIPGGKPPGGYRYCIVLPIVGIPDGMLWMVEYDSTGNQVGDCKLTNHVSYFVNFSYKVRFANQMASYVASHIEIMTLSMFSGFADLLNKPSFLRELLPDHVIWSVMPQAQQGYRP